VVIVLLTFVSITEYQELQRANPLVPTFRPHFVKLLSSTQVSKVMNGNTNASTWFPTPQYNYSDSVGTWQVEEIGGTSDGAVVEVFGYNISSYSSFQYAILPKLGEVGIEVSPNATFLTNGTLFSGSWKFKILGNCSKDLLSCDDIEGISLNAPYVVYVELYTYPGEFSSTLNATAIKGLLQAQISQTS
jgi:hypothetical protein